MAVGEKTIKIKITGDAKGLGKAAKDAEKEIGKFARIGNKLKQSFTSLLTDLPKQIGNLLSSGGIYIAAGVAAAITLGAPIIAAAFSSALLLGLGGGVLYLGITKALENEKVVKAFEGLKKKFDKIVEAFVKPFIKPMIRAAETFGKALDFLKPQIINLGKIIAPLIDKLAPAVAEFFKAVMPGITNAVKASVPLFEILAAKLPEIGKAISFFFTKVSENGDDTNQFFTDLLDIITKLIYGFAVVIGKLISWYSNVRTFLLNARTKFLEFTVFVLDIFSKILHAAGIAFGWIPGIGPKLKNAQKQFSEFRAHANNELNKIHDRDVQIRIFSNIGSVIGDITRQLQNLGALGVSGHRAMGGPTVAGKSYLVGEHGPEIWTAGTNGYVTPNDKIGSGGDTYIIIDGQILTERVDYRVQKNNRQIARQLKAA